MSMLSNIQAIIMDLKSKQENVRDAAARKLKDQFEKLAKESNLEILSTFIEEIKNALVTLTRSSDVNERLGGIAAIDNLIEFEITYEGPKKKKLNLINFLRNTLTNHSDPATVIKVTQALGKMAKMSSNSTSKTITAKWVEFETKRALEWLEDPNKKDEGKKFAAILVLKELAENSATLFYAFRSPFLEHIWNGLRDAKSPVREASILALRAVLMIISERQTLDRVVHYNDTFQKAIEPLDKTSKNHNIPCIHGSLLVIRELLNHTGNFMNDKFEIVQKVFDIMGREKNKTIKKTIVGLIPIFANFYKQRFCETHLTYSIDSIISLGNNASSPRELRGMCFTALGDLCAEVGAPIKPFVPKILEAIKDGMDYSKFVASKPQNAKQKAVQRNFVDEALITLSQLAVGIGETISEDILTLLDVMFSGGLTPSLIQSITTISQHIPSLLKQTQERLLDNISVILGRVPFSPIPSFLANINTTADGKIKSDEKMIILALQTLGSFNLKGHNLIDFVQDPVLNYLDHPNADVRKEAAITICQLLVVSQETDLMASNAKAAALASQFGDFKKALPVKGPYSLIIEEVIEKLLVVAVTDPNPTIRLAVVKSLKPSFDYYLSLADNLRSLFICMNDESFQIRQLSLSIIGRLSTLNPGCVLPSLRKTLLQLLVELEYSQEFRHKEEAAVMLGHLIEAAPGLISHYVSSILKILMVQVKSPNPNVTSTVLQTLGKLSSVGGAEVSKYLGKILPQIIDTLSDKILSKQVAVRTLGQLIQSTGEVISPYVKYPQLLNNLLNLIKNGEIDADTRNEVVKVLGIMGGLDPFKLSNFQQAKMLLDGKRTKKSQKGKEKKGIFSENNDGLADNNEEEENEDEDEFTHSPPHEKIIDQAMMKKEGGGDMGEQQEEEDEDQADEEGPIDAGASNNELQWKPEENMENANLMDLLGDEFDADMEGIQVELTAEVDESSGINSILAGIGPSSEDYYPTVAFSALVKILREKTLQTHHTDAIQCVMLIFQSLGMKCAPFLPKVMPPFVELIKTCSSHIRNSLIQQLSGLVSIVKQHIKNYLKDIFEIITKIWDEGKDSYKASLIQLVEQIAKALNEEFKPYLPIVIPRFVTVLKGDNYGTNQNATRIAKAALHSFSIFERHLEDYMFLLVPAVVKLVEVPDGSLSIRLSAVRATRKLIKSLPFMEYSSRVVHPLARVLQTPNAEGKLKSAAINTLCTLAFYLGADFAIYIPILSKIMVNIQHPFYQEYINKIIRGNVLPDPSVFFKKMKIGDFPQVESSRNAGSELLDDDSEEDEGPDLDSTEASPAASTEYHKMVMNTGNLEKAWDAQNRSTKADWIEWIRGFSIELLRESPSPALRACSPLAQTYHPLARELFDSGFISCWNEMDEISQKSVVTALELAFGSPNLPTEVLQTLLNLAEFMEHNDKPLPVSVDALGALSKLCKCFAKALHYKEIQFHKITPPSDDLIEELISINNQLQQHEAAMGVLKYSQKHFNHSLNFKESWLEKLQRWEEALEEYEKKLPTKKPMISSPGQQNGEETNENKSIGQNSTIETIMELDPTLKITLGKMRSLAALSEWEKLFELCESTWQAENLSPKAKDSILKMGAEAAWHLGEWEAMKKYIQNTSEPQKPQGNAIGAPPPSSEDATRMFYQAIVAIHDNRFLKAAELIEKTRVSIGKELQTVVNESYNRAYDLIVKIQQLSEMEEMIDYKKLQLFEKGEISNLLLLEEEEGEHSFFSNRNYFLLMIQQNDNHRSLTSNGEMDDNSSFILEKKDLIRRIWKDRLLGMKRDVEIWEKILSVRQLVVPHEEDPETWLKFASICRKFNRMKLSRNTLLHLIKNTLKKTNENPNLIEEIESNPEILITQTISGNIEPKIVFEFFKHLRCEDTPNSKEKAFNLLSAFVSNRQTFKTKMGKKLLSKCFLTLGEWLESGIWQELEEISNNIVKRNNYQDYSPILEQYEQEIIPQILRNYFNSAQTTNNYKAWHSWAMMNSQVVNYIERREQLQKKILKHQGSPQGVVAPSAPIFGAKQSPASAQPTDRLAKSIEANNTLEFLHNAIDGYIKSISLSRDRSNTLQDVLRLLTLWFNHGNEPSIELLLKSGFRVISIDTWLQVIPQVIARINSPVILIRKLIQELLEQVGKAHPQSLIYPLTLCSKSTVQSRKQEADMLLTKMRKHDKLLVEQALLVSQELIRVAILWNELWQEGIDDASLLYFQEKDVDSMYQTLKPLHEMIQNPETEHERDFVIQYAQELSEAFKHLTKFVKTRKENDVSAAWDCYYHIFRKLNKQLPLVSRLELQIVSPQLQAAENLKLAVPGTYRANSAGSNSSASAIGSIPKKKMLGSSSISQNNNSLATNSGINGSNSSSNIQGMNGSQMAINSSSMSSGSSSNSSQREENCVRIDYFARKLKVMSSKQRPRQLKMFGSDGKKYHFLLKGHEDLRLDERVMQLFGLVSTLFVSSSKHPKAHLSNVTSVASRKLRIPAPIKSGSNAAPSTEQPPSQNIVENLLNLNDSSSTATNQTTTSSFSSLTNNRTNLSIKRYAVIPLSSNAGLLGWVENCDTLHQLIKEYRESKDIVLNVEHRLMLQMAPDFEHLPLIQKIEVFKYALDSTSGQDLYSILWLKSKSSEVWLYRRTNYIRSLAVMSMVGYILGLGDRHPSNLMIERLTGKVVHIDFGDCFEVAMRREKFPERVPFRLTRMLVNAMEVCGIEGTFRSTCESVMSILRENKDSLMAMLEAFVHDPLINWRLLDTKTNKANKNKANPNPNAAPNQPPAVPNTTIANPKDQNKAKADLTISTNVNTAVNIENNKISQHKINSNFGAEENEREKERGNIDREHIPSRSVREKELKKTLFNAKDDAEGNPEKRNKKALEVISRISKKLTGRDFEDQDNDEETNEKAQTNVPPQPLNVPEQVNRLMQEATSYANLAVAYVGWCSFW